MKRTFQRPLALLLTLVMLLGLLPTAALAATVTVDGTEYEENVLFSGSQVISSQSYNRTFTVDDTFKNSISAGGYFRVEYSVESGGGSDPVPQLALRGNAASGWKWVTVDSTTTGTGFAEYSYSACTATGKWDTGSFANLAEVGVAINNGTKPLRVTGISYISPAFSYNSFDSSQPLTQDQSVSKALEDGDAAKITSSGYFRVEFEATGEINYYDVPLVLSDMSSSGDKNWITVQSTAARFGEVGDNSNKYYAEYTYEDCKTGNVGNPVKGWGETFTDLKLVGVQNWNSSTSITVTSIAYYNVASVTSVTSDGYWKVPYSTDYMVNASSFTEKIKEGGFFRIEYTLGKNSNGIDLTSANVVLALSGSNWATISPADGKTGTTDSGGCYSDYTYAQCENSLTGLNYVGAQLWLSSSTDWWVVDSVTVTKISYYSPKESGEETGGDKYQVTLSATHENSGTDLNSLKQAAFDKAEGQYDANTTIKVNGKVWADSNDTNNAHYLKSLTVNGNTPDDFTPYEDYTVTVTAATTIVASYMYAASKPVYVAQPTLPTGATLIDHTIAWSQDGWFEPSSGEENLGYVYLKHVGGEFDTRTLKSDGYFGLMVRTDNATADTVKGKLYLSFASNSGNQKEYVTLSPSEVTAVENCAG